MSSKLEKVKVVMPEKSQPRPEYYDKYVRYVTNILLANNVDIKYEGIDNDARFIMIVNGDKVAIDYSDHPIIENSLLNCKGYFKFHCKKKHTKIKNIFPFAPVSFYDWKRYNELKKEIKYTCNNDVVLNVQRPYGNAKERRRHVRGLLYIRYRASGKLIYSPYYHQEDYWKLINNCLVHVFVPGCYNNMLDRGHIQYLAFGCCTIAPRILDLLPWDKELIPGTHYIECKTDYSDVIEKVEWSKKHRDVCIEIGRNAQKLFEDSCTPEKLWQWILHNISK